MPDPLRLCVVLPEELRVSVPEGLWDWLGVPLTLAEPLPLLLPVPLAEELRVPVEDGVWV